eukprot:m51a1_g14506 hypothetical protein (1207) ;mRNA; f:807552-817253
MAQLVSDEPLDELVCEDGPAGVATRWTALADVRIRWANGLYVVQRGFHCPGGPLRGLPDCVDPVGWLLREWLYATRGDADGARVASHAQVDVCLNGRYPRRAVEWLRTEYCRSDKEIESQWTSAYLDPERISETAFWELLPEHTQQELVDEAERTRKLAGELEAAQVARRVAEQREAELRAEQQAAIERETAEYLRRVEEEKARLAATEELQRAEDQLRWSMRTPKAAPAAPLVERRMSSPVRVRAPTQPQRVDQREVDKKNLSEDARKLDTLMAKHGSDALPQQRKCPPAASAAPRPPPQPEVRATRTSSLPSSATQKQAAAAAAVMAGAIRQTRIRGTITSAPEEERPQAEAALARQSGGNSSAAAPKQQAGAAKTERAREEERRQREEEKRAAAAAPKQQAGAPAAGAAKAARAREERRLAAERAAAAAKQASAKPAAAPKPVSEEERRQAIDRAAALALEAMKKRRAQEDRMLEEERMREEERAACAAKAEASKRVSELESIKRAKAAAAAEIQRREEAARRESEAQAPRKTSKGNTPAAAAAKAANAPRPEAQQPPVLPARRGEEHKEAAAAGPQHQKARPLPVPARAKQARGQNQGAQGAHQDGKPHAAPTSGLATVRVDMPVAVCAAQEVEKQQEAVRGPDANRVDAVKHAIPALAKSENEPAAKAGGETNEDSEDEAPELDLKCAAVPGGEAAAATKTERPPVRLPEPEEQSVDEASEVWPERNSARKALEAEREDDRRADMSLAEASEVDPVRKGAGQAEEEEEEEEEEDSSEEEPELGPECDPPAGAMPSLAASLPFAFAARVRASIGSILGSVLSSVVSDYDEEIADLEDYDDHLAASLPFAFAARVRASIGSILGSVLSSVVSDYDEEIADLEDYDDQFEQPEDEEGRDEGKQGAAASPEGEAAEDKEAEAEEEDDEGEEEKSSPEDEQKASDVMSKKEAGKHDENGGHAEKHPRRTEPHDESLYTRMFSMLLVALPFFGAAALGVLSQTCRVLRTKCQSEAERRKEVRIQGHRNPAQALKRLGDLSEYSLLVQALAWNCPNLSSVTARTNADGLWDSSAFGDALCEGLSGALAAVCLPSDKPRPEDPGDQVRERRAAVAGSLPSRLMVLDCGASVVAFASFAEDVGDILGAAQGREEPQPQPLPHLEVLGLVRQRHTTWSDVVRACAIISRTRLAGGRARTEHHPASSLLRDS